MPSRRDVLAAVGTGSIGLLAGCTGDDPVRGDWHRAGYDDGNTGDARRHRGPKSNPVVKWSARIPETYNVSSPVLVDDSVYVGYGNDEFSSGADTVGVRVLDLETGRPKDDFEVATSPRDATENGATYFDSVVHANGNLFVQCFDGLHSLTTDGEERWHVPMHGGPTEGGLRTAHSVVTDGFVYAPTAGVTADTDGPKAKEALYAIDDSSGQVVWKHVPQTDEQGWTFPPAYARGVVYLSGLDYGVVALNGKSGFVQWKTELAANGPPVLADGRVFVSGELPSGEAFVVALDAGTGDEQWRVSGRGTWLGRRLGVADGKVYFTENLRDFVALDAATGDELWRHNYPSGVERSTPAITDEAIYVGAVKNRSDDGIAVLDPETGEEVSFGAIENGNGLESSIALSDGLAVVTANSDTVYAFESCGFSLAGHCLS
ncbi:PQQ-binding-like beta-propeller repeat protein [Haladaptatus sp. DYF46]|uniref:outer membrane protein assembly factor BamB family protein n=1 Tax=Haladaptatus sp. DYF46 TaxID=2886041 RepID=UPI001E6171D4|nr:PQQ-binding-like beta-propeller repeat protein [Haladaptatus sp. DYF46]